MVTRHSYWIFSLASLLALLVTPASAHAEVPATFTLDAQVFDEDAPDGFSYQGVIRVDLYDAAQDGSSLWYETHLDAAIYHGFLSLPLGSVNTVTPLADVLLANAGETLYLQVALSGIGYTLPGRLPVTSVPYALAASEADNAQALQGLGPDAFSYNGHSHAWSEITEKPTTFAPSAHDHTTSDLTDWPAILDDNQVSWSEVQSKPTEFTPSAHVHAWSDLTSDVPSAFEDGEISWSEVQSKPSTFPPEVHSQGWDTITGKPTEFAPAAHEHDERYFTETELDPAQSGGGVLDDRYYEKATADATFLGLHAKADSAVTADQVGGQSMLGAMKTALGLSGLSDQAFTDYMQKLCPLGYERDETGDNANYIICKKGSDEMVKVGDFWVDRYETTIVDVTKYASGSCDGSGGTFYGRSDGDAHTAGFFRNGMDDPPNSLTREDFVPLYACSLEEQTPSRWITWFQAERACNLAGKHLCTNAEWQGAAYGTPDDSTSCNVSTSGPQTGAARPDCMSDYGAVNMVGNLWEWTANWHGQGADSNDGSQPDAGEFHGDGYWNVDNAQANGSYGEGNPVFPASARRGGNWSNGSEAGVFALPLSGGPANWDHSIGARCCRR